MSSISLPTLRILVSALVNQPSTDLQLPFQTSRKNIYTSSCLVSTKHCLKTWPKGWLNMRFNASSHSSPSICIYAFLKISPSVWKPLRGPLHDWPLTVCDATTVDVDMDLIPSDQVFPHHVVENIQVHFSLNQKWHYLSEQKADELWIFQQSPRQSVGSLRCGKFLIFVPKECGGDSRYKGTPHCSFFDETGFKDGILRESIECRALVYFGECRGPCAG
jgi:hypothetical protein